MQINRLSILIEPNAIPEMGGKTFTLKVNCDGQIFSEKLIFLEHDSFSSEFDRLMDRARREVHLVIENSIQRERERRKLAEA